MNVSECFYSIQGEGVSQGVPAFFVRLSGCNMICGGPNGALLKLGRATWWCDSEAVWKRGTDHTHQELLEKIAVAGREESVDLLEGILSGVVHLIWTGGEPSMDKNRQAILGFLSHLQAEYPGNKSFHELETNGTIPCPDGFYQRMDQINCSPKLANSGMKAVVRVVPEAIHQINEHQNSWFKFVVSREEDIREIEETYLAPFKIDKRKVVIMPAVDNLKDLPGATRSIYQITKKTCYRAVTRSHILAWDRTTGV